MTLKTKKVEANRTNDRYTNNSNVSMNVEKIKQDPQVDKLIAKILEQEKQIQSLKRRLEYVTVFNDSLMRSLEKARSKDNFYMP